MDDRPLLSQRLGLSHTEVVPALRVERDLKAYLNGTLEQKMFAKSEERLGLDFIRNEPEKYRSWTLSPELLVTAGATPERAYLRLVEVDARSIESSSLRFFDIRDLLKHMDAIHCEHTRSAIYRSAHALGIFDTQAESLLLS